MQVEAPETSSDEYLIRPIVHTQACKRVRFRQSECRICVEICPTDAITLPFGPELGDTCVNCGLCEVACPTESFECAQNTDQMIVNALEYQREKLVVNHNLYVHCHRAQAGNSYSLAVNCIGNMTENALLAAANADARVILISTGDCSGCQLCKGEELFKQEVGSYKKLAKLLPRPELAIKTRVSEKQKMSQSDATDRRAFFRSIGTGVAKQVAKTISDKERQIKALLQQGDETIIKYRSSQRRDLLKSLLTDLRDTPGQSDKEANRDDNSHSANLEYRKMVVDVPHCVGCGVCVNVCPTGALTKEVNDLELTRTINYSRCTNCGVCAEACPQQVISFEQPYSLDDLTADTEEIVAKVPLSACMICGEIIPVSEGEVCTTCQKRQVVPMFM